MPRATMARKPQVLLITPVVPDPNGSGRSLRAYAWLKVLGRDCDVHLLVAGGQGQVEQALGVASTYFLEAELPVRWRRALGLMLPVLGLFPGFVADFLKPKHDGDFLGWLGSIRPDRIVVFRLYLHEVAAVVRASLPGIRCDIDLDDLESDSRFSIARCLIRLGRWRRGIRELIVALQYWFAEQVLLSRYHSVHLAAQEDVVRVRRRFRSRLAAFPNRILPRRLLTTDRRFRVLFVGSLGYPPNEEAAVLLIDKVAPLLTHLPNLKVTIAGRSPNAALRRQLLGNPLIDFFEDASDLAPLYASALAVVVPLRAGGGTKIKTIEALAYGRPLVSTAEGVRGMDAEAGVNYLAAETAVDFAASIGRLADEPELADRIGSSGYSFWQRDLSL
jgi:glycosyltransferase involved in cell wall biosynthesis